MLSGALGGLGSALGGAIGMATAGDGGKKFLKQIQELWDTLEVSNFDFTKLSPAVLQQVAEYLPEVYEVFEAQAPTLSGDSEAGRAAQLQGIDYFRGIRDGGMPLSMRLASDEASRAVSDEFGRTQEGIRSQYAMRGRLGAGEELQSRLGSDQRAMELARGLGADQAQRQEQMRLGAAGQMAGIGSQERGQTLGREQFNADAVNRFNQWMGTLQTQANRDNAMARQAASDRNVGTRQRVSDTNELNRYANQASNLDRHNQLLSQQFGQEVTKRQGQTSALDNLATAAYNERQARVQNAQSLGQGIGSTVGAVGDLFAGGGGLGSGVQGLYGDIYGQQRRY